MYIIYIIVFLCGTFIGMGLSLFVTAAGTLNKEIDSYEKGFKEGYEKGLDMKGKEN